MKRLTEIAERAMREYGFLPEPPAAALAEVKSSSPPPPDGADDLCALPWTSIDNPESRDLDQVEVVEKVDGGVRLRVGIADVDAFVRPASATDRYAGHNTTTVYTPPRNFLMLPERLSYDLSSLVAGATRRAVVIETMVHRDGTEAAGRVYPALIQNRAKLDYPSVSAWLDGATGPPGPIASEPAVRAQRGREAGPAQILAAARRRAGAIDVETLEAHATLGPDGQVSALVVKKQDRAGRVIEELMIASNRTVAGVLDAAGLPSIRRVVREPERWARIVAYAGERGVHLPAQPSSAELAKFVDKMRLRHSPEEFAEISLALIKLMGRGEYVAHAPGETEIGHFGLATAQYVHATAPNRRYVDLVTQRLLGRRAAPPYDRDALAIIAAHATAQESAAQKVERRVHKA